MENILGDVDGGWDLFVWGEGYLLLLFFLCNLRFSRTRTLTTTIRYAEQSPTSSMLVQINWPPRETPNKTRGQPVCFFQDGRVEG